MTYPTLTVTEDLIFKVLGDFLQSQFDPNIVPVVRGQVNRVSPPQQESYIVMWSLFRERLETNTDDYSDVAFTGSISTNVLTVTQMINGVITVNALLSANGIAANTTIVSQLTGTPGGAGTYQVSVQQTLASTTIQCGTRTIIQATKVTVQIDCHGSKGADNAQIIATLFRDAEGVDAFINNAANIDVQPLYCGDARQTPFINDSQQYEDRWSVDLVMQANPATQKAQEFAGTVTVPITNVDATYHV